MEGESMSQGGEGEQSRMAGGGAGQHTKGASKETTQEGPDIALAEEETPIPSVSPHDTLADNLTNSGLGARDAKHQGQCHLAAPSRRRAHPRALPAADLPDLVLKKCHNIGLDAVRPMLTLLHRRQARRLWLR